MAYPKIHPALESTAQARLPFGLATACPHADRVIWVAANRIILRRTDLDNGVVQGIRLQHGEFGDAVGARRVSGAAEAAQRRAGGGAMEPGGRRAEHVPAVVC